MIGEISECLSQEFGSKTFDWISVGYQTGLLHPLVRFFVPEGKGALERPFNLVLGVSNTDSGVGAGTCFGHVCLNVLEVMQRGKRR